MDPFKDLNDALTAADLLGGSSGNPSKIIVAEGVYLPTASIPGVSLPTGVTFMVPAGVEITGGYTHIGGSWTSTGNPENTILEGLLANGARSNNVVYCKPSPGHTDITQLHTLRIRNGSASAIGHLSGAGIYAKSPGLASPVVLRLDNCLIEDNLAGEDGGGIYFDGSFTPGWLGVFTTKFKGNAAKNRGGGVYMHRMGAILTPDFTFTMPSWIYNCEFSRNSAGLKTDFASLQTSGGGAIYVGLADGNPIIANSLFYSNLARGRGSVLYFGGQIGGAFQFQQNTASGNILLVGPGGVNAQGEPLHSSPGGTIYVSSGPIGVTNSILYGNYDVLMPSEIVLTANSSASVSGSNVKGMNLNGIPVVWPGLGNINANPEFIDLMNVFTLVESSPCVDAGGGGIPPDYPNYSQLPVDYEFRVNLARVDGRPPLVDIGCYEFH